MIKTVNLNGRKVPVITLKEMTTRELIDKTKAMDRDSIVNVIKSLFKIKETHKAYTLMLIHKINQI